MSRAPSPNENLMVAAAALRRGNPSQWDDFIKAYSAHVIEQVELCVFSPVELLQVAQGRAQHASALLETLQDFDAADKVTARRNK